MKKILPTLFFALFYLISLGQVQVGNDIDGLSSDESLGYNCSLSQVGNRLIVSSPSDATNGYAAGKVAVYENDNGNWNLVGNVIYGYNSEDQFGRGVTISSDGNTIAIGAPYEDGAGSNRGSVRVYNYNGTSWIMKGSVILGGNSDEELGSSVDLSSDGNRLAIGIPESDAAVLEGGSVKVYDFNGSDWILSTTINGDRISSKFGNVVDLSASGNQLIVGSWYNGGVNGETGQAFVYEYNGSIWQQKGNTLSGNTNSIFFGISVSVSGDGNRIAVGDIESSNSFRGYVKVYKWEANDWVQINGDIVGNSTSERFGWDLSFDHNGNNLAVGAYQINTSRIYSITDNSWSQVGSDIVGENNNTTNNAGFSVSISSNGSYLAIGDPNNSATQSYAGHIRVYNIINLLDIEEFNLIDQLVLHPNPASSKTAIDFNGVHSKIQINIYNLLGEKVYTNTYYNSSKSIIETNSLSNGIYFVKVSSNNGDKTIKLLVER